MARTKKAKPRPKKAPKTGRGKGAGKAQAPARKAPSTSVGTFRGLSEQARAVAEARRELARKRRAKKKPPTDKQRARLEKLAGKNWAKLSEKQRHDLRAWRAQKGAETRERRRLEEVAKTARGRKYIELVERLNSTDRRVRKAAREEVRAEGTDKIARFLHDDLGWEDDDISDAIAFWFYSE
jgi:hypothetical protein